jgi:hypothetical protein
MHKRQTTHHETDQKYFTRRILQQRLRWCMAPKFSHLRDSCLSRTGFIIVLAGVPIHWSRKIQTEIALSSIESEYIALRQCCRALLLMRRTLKTYFHVAYFLIH